MLCVYACVVCVCVANDVGCQGVCCSVFLANFAGYHEFLEKNPMSVLLFCKRDLRIGIVSFLFSNSDHFFSFFQQTRTICFGLVCKRDLKITSLSAKHCHSCLLANMRNSHFCIFDFSFFVSPLLGSFILPIGVSVAGGLFQANHLARRNIPAHAGASTHKNENTHTYTHAQE